VGYYDLFPTTGIERGDAAKLRAEQHRRIDRLGELDFELMSPEEYDDAERNGCLGADGLAPEELAEIRRDEEKERMELARRADAHAAMKRARERRDLGGDAA